MKNTTQNYRQSLDRMKTRLPKSLMGIFVLAIASVPNFVLAQSLVQFAIGESAQVLEAAIDLQNGDISQTEFNVIQVAEHCKSPSARLQARNRPWMSVWNTSATPDDVSSVTIDLTEAGFEFGDGDMTGDGFEGLLSMLSYRSDAGVSLASANYGSDNSELVLNFTGLSQGVAAIFRVDLDNPGGITMFPDYREAMLGAEVTNGLGRLALLTTNFSSGASNIATFGRAGPLPTSGIAESYRNQTTSEVVPSTVIPEPTTLVLLLAGLTGIATMRRYR